MTKRFWIVSCIVLVVLLLGSVGLLFAKGTPPGSLSYQQGDTVQTNNLDGNLSYVINDKTIELVLWLERLPSGAHITFQPLSGQAGVLLGEGNSYVKLGKLQEETVFYGERNGLIFWAQLPIRMLNGEDAFIVTVKEAESQNILSETIVHTTR